MDAHCGESVDRASSAGRVARVTATLLAALLGSGCGGGGGGGGGDGNNGGGGGNPNGRVGIAAVVLSFPAGAAPPGFVGAGSNSGAVVQVVNQDATTPITNATVSVNGVRLQYVTSSQEYEGELDISPGAAVTVRVDVGGATYSVVQDQFSAYPTIVAPQAGDTWSEVRQNVVRWSATPPRSTTRYALGIFDIAGNLQWPMNGLQDLPGTASELTISIGQLIAGESLVLLGFVESFDISNTIAGSGLVLGGFNYVPITIAAASETLEGIETSPAVATVGLNSSRHVAATGRYADGSRQDVSTEATWTSSDPSRVAVDSSGLVTGLGAGDATITAELGGFSASSVVSVYVPTPSPAPPLGQSVAYQIDYAHSGRVVFDEAPTFPPNPAWSVTLNGTISYPVIAGDKAYVTTNADSTGLSEGASLYALDLATGNVLWGPVDIPTSRPWSGHALDQDRLFVLSHDGDLRTFDAATGSPQWSINLGGQYFNAPPTAANGIVYVGGGARLKAVEAATGKILWSSEVASGDKSSPAVSSDGVYVSYPCQAYKFDPYSGESLWHYDDGCAGGGGKTTVYANGELFARETTSMLQDRIFNADTGTIVGTFASDVAPAFTDQTGFFLHDGTLQAIDQTTRNVLWSFVGDNALVTAPVVINDTVVIGSYTGIVFALDAATGSMVWSDSAGGQIEGPDEQNVSAPLVGLGAGEGYLVVPAGNRLTAWRVVP